MAISITSRIRNAMVGLTVGLCALYAGLTFLLVYVIEDQVFVNQIRVEQLAFEQVISDADLQAVQRWQPTNGNIQRVDSVAELPNSLFAAERERVMAQTGVHEYFDDHNAMFIAHLLRTDTGAAYFLVYDVADLLAVRGAKAGLFVLLAGLTLMITALAVLMARRLAKATLAPVSRLTNALQNEDLDEVVIQLANEFSADEIGVLTRELALALERVRDAAQREYEFNRGVSHELRSPIQAAQSATELLQLVCTEENPAISNPVARLQRSITEMNEIAEAFLWLASDRAIEPQERGTVAAINHTLISLQTAFPDRKIILHTTLFEDFRYPIPSTVLSTVVRNLINNALVHGASSTIDVELTADQIRVSNAVGKSANKGRGFGVGLSIVQRICDRFGCTLECSESGEQRYSTAVRLSGRASVNKKPKDL